MTAAILLLLVALFMIRRKESLVATLTEPITRGLSALLFKSVPQLYLAFCIANAGQSKGLPGLSLFIGHVTIAARLVEIFLAAKQDGWNRKNIGLMISESGNEVSWLVVTIVWFMY